MKNTLYTLALLICFSSFGQMTQEERAEKIMSESYLYDENYKDMNTECEALDATVVLMKEMIAMVEATYLSGISDSTKQEYLSWTAKYYSFTRRFMQLGLSEFSEESGCSNYSIYESIKNSTQSEKFASQLNLILSEI